MQLQLSARGNKRKIEPFPRAWRGQSKSAQELNKSAAIKRNLVGVNRSAVAVRNARWKTAHASPQRIETEMAMETEPSRWSV